MDFADFAKDKLWAITPEAFDTILRQVHEFKFDAQEASTIAAIQASIPARGGYALQDGIAVIDVAGPLSRQRLPTAPLKGLRCGLIHRAELWAAWMKSQA